MATGRQQLGKLNIRHVETYRQRKQQNIMCLARLRYSKQGVKMTKEIRRANRREEWGRMQTGGIQRQTADWSKGNRAEIQKKGKGKKRNAKGQDKKKQTDQTKQFLISKIIP